MLNEKGQRELAYVVRIDGIFHIEGAERVEVAQVGGWRIMVKKGQFRVEDLALWRQLKLWKSMEYHGFLLWTSILLCQIQWMNC